MSTLDTSDLSLALKQTRLFAPASRADLGALVSRSRVVRLSAGTYVFQAGDPAQGLYVVLSGRTKAVRHGPDGREQVIHEDGPGSTYPEVAVFDDRPYPSTVIAVEDSELLFLPKLEVRQFCLRHPEVALSALRILSERLRRATGMVEVLALRDVSQRLAEYLVSEWESAGGGPRFTLRHSNQDIADLIGTVREVVSRGFRRLQGRGWLAKEGRRIEVLDPAALKVHAEG